MYRIPVPPGIGYIPQQPHMNRVRNIILETIEVAFIICNSRLKPFDVNTIGMLMSSIVPTAFVVNTAFWVFFMSNRRKGALCVCNRYRLGACKHVTERNYWIIRDGSYSQGIKVTSDRSTPPTPILGPAHIGHLYAVPKDVLVNINQIDHFGTLEIYVHFYVKLLPNEMDNINKNTGRSCEYSVDSRKLTKHVIKTRFRIIPEYEPAEPMIIFSPHPSMHNGYGHFIPELLNQYTFLSPYGHIKLIPAIHKLYSMEIPTFTLIMEYLSTWCLRPLWDSTHNITKTVDKTTENKQVANKNNFDQKYVNNSNPKRWGYKTRSDLVEEAEEINTTTNEDESNYWPLLNIFSKCTIRADNNNNIVGVNNDDLMIQSCALVEEIVGLDNVCADFKWSDPLETIFTKDVTTESKYQNIFESNVTENKKRNKNEAELLPDLLLT